MNRRSFIFSALAVTALAASNGLPTFAQTVKEASSGIDFPSQVKVSGTSATITGTGIRKKFGFKVYAIASYIDGSKLNKGGDIYGQLLTDGPAKQITMHFVRDVDQGKIREAFAEGLEKNIPNYASSPAKKDAEAFLNLMTDIKNNDEIIIWWTSGGKIDLSIRGKYLGSFQNPTLAKGLWSIWLGASPISGDIKTGLIANAK